MKKKDNNNYFKYEKFKKTEISNLFQSYGDYNSDKFISIAKSVNDFFICTPVMSDCEIKKYSLENIQSLLDSFRSNRNAGFIPVIFLSISILF